MRKKRGLGKGLEALIPQNIENEDNSENIKEIDIDKIKPREGQPRTEFDSDALDDLKESIKDYGLIQPIIVVKDDNLDQYTIVAGERRYRASKLAGLKKVPVIVKNLDIIDVEILSLIENIQRKDLNPIEEARAYKKFSEDFNMTQEEISKKLGKSRSYIANSLRLLNLDEDSLEDLKNGNISQSQARILLSIDDLDERKEYRELLIKKEINIKEIEEILKKKKNKTSYVRKRENKKDIYILEMEDRFRQALGTKVNINKRGKVWNTTIELYNMDDVEDLLRRLE